MILLLGGTSETALTAEALARAGYRVLVSTATDIPLFVGSHPGIAHRRGPLPKAELAQLIRERGVQAIIDATHPFASHIRQTAPCVAQEEGIPYLTYVRPGVERIDKEVLIAETHEEAARLACNSGKPVLLTVGSRNVMVYAQEANRANIALVARVLDHPDSLRACREAGIPEERIITGRGPFSVEENRRLIRRFDIGVLVTKDSGNAGGVVEKLEAARLENCCVVLVGRPIHAAEGAFSDLADLLEELKRRVKPEFAASLARLPTEDNSIHTFSPSDAGPAPANCKLLH